MRYGLVAFTPSRQRYSTAVLCRLTSMASALAMVHGLTSVSPQVAWYDVELRPARRLERGLSVLGTEDATGTGKTHGNHGLQIGGVLRCI
jgi:hypothetical protein